jgi:hypothetical protein
MNQLPKTKLLGQVFTPSLIAKEMVDLIVKSNSFSKLDILDPCVGPATFLKAFTSVQSSLNISYHGFDIDPEMVKYTKQYANKLSIKSKISKNDYLEVNLKSFSPNAIIMNPPYVRHEWINLEKKAKYKSLIEKSYKNTIDGRSNLYIYFLLKSFHELMDNGILCMIVYDSITSSSYGKKALDMILAYGDIEYQKTIQAPFENTLIDAKILLIRKKLNKKQKPIESARKIKNTTLLKNLFDARRGTGLINSKLFIAKENDPFFKYAKPFLKKQPLNKLLIHSSSITQKAYIFEKGEHISTKLIKWLNSEADILCTTKVNSKTLENKIKTNDAWQYHTLHTAPILFNYYIRNNPRFLYNADHLPFSDNFYGLYPKNINSTTAWLLLNTQTYIGCILLEARNQGNGLKKIQLTEFKNASIPDWRLFQKNDLAKLNKLAQKLIVTPSSFDLINKADLIVKKYLID